MTGAPLTAEELPVADPPRPAGTRSDAGALLRRAAALGVARAGPHLVIREPRGTERVVALGGPCTVGRGGSAALRLDDPSTSRLHLRLQVDGTGTVVEDLGSRNGLRINGRRARGLRRLRSGDRLELGGTLLQFVDPLEPPGPAGSPASPAPAHRSRSARLALSALLLALAAALLVLP